MKIRNSKSVIRLGLFVLLAGSLLPFSGCRENSRLIKKATFQLGENIETLRVALVLTDRVQSPMAGGFAIRDYGYVFINPYTEETPLELGFYLNTSIVNEQDYLELTPTSVYPNGVPIGLDYPIVQLSQESPVSENFDLFAYVDVRFGRWLGAAAMFKFMSSDYFPPGLTISQGLSPDEDGIPRVVAGIFGPKVDSNGEVVQQGGIMLLANAKRLLEDLKKKDSGELIPDDRYFVSGADAEINSDAKRIWMLQEQVVQGFQSPAALE